MGKGGTYESVHFSLMYISPFFKKELFIKKLVAWSKQVYFIII